MRICFDMDGVIATVVPDGDYSKAQPIQTTVDLINALHDKGHKILINTARGFVSGKDWRDLTLEQLMLWGVNFDALYFDKPGADYYVDDRSVTLDFLEECVLKEKENEKEEERER